MTSAYVSQSCYYTYMAKLTLSVDGRVVRRAKEYAKRRGVSVSKMVETYLAAVAEPPSPAAGRTPILDSLRGLLDDGDIADYKKHLAAKYR
jgi:hypothetical protein